GTATSVTSKSRSGSGISTRTQPSSQPAPPAATTVNDASNPQRSHRLADATERSTGRQEMGFVSCLVRRAYRRLSPPRLCPAGTGRDSGRGGPSSCACMPGSARGVRGSGGTGLAWPPGGLEFADVLDEEACRRECLAGPQPSGADERGAHAVGERGRDIAGHVVADEQHLAGRAPAAALPSRAPIPSGP